MTAGLRVINDSGAVQIDSDYQVFEFKAKGTAYCTTNDGGSITRYITTITVTSNGAPMIAIRSSVLVGYIGAAVSGSSWTFYFTSNTYNAQVDWYHFDKPDAAASYGNVGLRLFKADGTLAVHSDMDIMRIAGVHNPSLGAASYPAGRTYAAIQNSSGFSWQETAPVGKGSGNYKSWAAGAYWSGVDCYSKSGFINGIQIDNFSPGSVNETYNAPDVQFIVVDVTGY